MMLFIAYLHTKDGIIMDLSFGEQIKIILKRKHMTLQDLASLYEASTGTKMTRQNLSQRLKRDNFPEQDMHLIAALLGYKTVIELQPAETIQTAVLPSEPVISAQQSAAPAPVPETQKVTTADGSTLHVPNLLRKPTIFGEINPLTGQEYLSNTVRRHPTLPDYVQVYDRSTHAWSDVNEDYFWSFQANKKELLGTDYQEPIMI